MQERDVFLKNTNCPYENEKLTLFTAIRLSEELLKVLPYFRNKFGFFIRKLWSRLGFVFRVLPYFVF